MLVYASPNHYRIYHMDREAIFTAVTLRELSTRGASFLENVSFMEVCIPPSRQKSALPPKVCHAVQALYHRSRSGPLVRLSIDHCLSLLEIEHDIAWRLTRNCWPFATFRSSPLNRSPWEEGCGTFDVGFMEEFPGYELPDRSSLHCSLVLNLEYRRWCGLPIRDPGNDTLKALGIVTVLEVALIVPSLGEGCNFAVVRNGESIDCYCMGIRLVALTTLMAKTSMTLSSSVARLQERDTISERCTFYHPRTNMLFSFSLLLPCYEFHLAHSPSSPSPPSASPSSSTSSNVPRGTLYSLNSVLFGSLTSTYFPSSILLHISTIVLTMPHPLERLRPICSANLRGS